MNQKTTNRLLLKWAADQIGIPFTREEAAEYVESRGLDSAFVPASIAYLTAAEFFDQAGTAASPMWKCNARGLRQAKREVKPDELDPMIWGNP